MSNRQFRRDPSYRLHRQSGQAIVAITDGNGSRRDVLLGKYGTAASREEYRRVLAEWEARGRTLAQPTAEKLSINELLAAFWPWAQKHYRRPDGSVTHEVNDYRLSLRPLRHMYQTLPAADFSPLKLKAVRQLMVTGYDHPKYGPQPPLCRNVINRRVGRIVREFLQLDSQAYLFPPRAAVAHRLTVLRANRKSKVQPSQKDRTAAKPRRTAGPRYISASYLLAVYRACDRAFPPPAPLAKRDDETYRQWQARLTPEQKAEFKQWRKAHRWHPNQLRHAHATNVRRQYGLEAAQVALGHAQANVTQVYAERDAALAVKVAAEIG